jgi:SseB protein N-terminal domain
VPGRTIADQRFPADDGSADPAVTAALAAYLAGQGSERSALLALAASRLLVPVVAIAADQSQDSAAGREHTSEMALPTVVGNDGRPAMLAFTSAGSLARWRPEARPVPVHASAVWQAAAQEAGAVVIDLAGPVPVAVTGARLARLAAGSPPPFPHEDPDVARAAAGAAAAEPVIAAVRLLPGERGCDLILQVRLAPGHGPAGQQTQQAVGRMAAKIMAVAEGALRRGIEVAVTGTGEGRVTCRAATEPR